LIARTPDLEPSISSYGSGDAEPSGRSKTEWLQIFWQQRQFLKRLTIRGLLAVTLLAFLIPKRYESTTRIMPPDSESSPGMGMLAALAGRGGSGGGDSGLASSGGSMPGLGMLASDLLGAKSTGATLAGILKSDTIRDRLIDRFNLQKAYWDRYKEDARKDLGKFTEIVEDRKSGIITVTVTDRNPQRASALAKAYVDEMKRHPQRVFWRGKEGKSEQELVVEQIAHRILSGFYNNEPYEAGKHILRMDSMASA